MEPLTLRSLAVAGRTLTVAAVDPLTYRAFTPAGTATVDAVWTAVQGGEIVLTHNIGRSLRLPPGNTLPVPGADGLVSLAVGAWASTVPSVDAVVSHRTGRLLGLGTTNAAVVSIRPSRSVDEARALVEEVVDGFATIHVLGARTMTGQAYLMGGELAELVGSFSYQPLADGSILPDRAWVDQNIRTEAVPILGDVTCHRVMLPQLRGAMADIERAGLASTIDPSDYGGCYVPRFIGRDPARGLSLHSWGIALDLNVQGNLRGTVGEIDRRVVRIFKAWGFAWGGDWQWTDPMHFELAWIPG